MNRPVNFSEDNLAVQWQYVKRNLKDMGIWSDIEQKVKDTVKLSLQTIIWEEFDLKYMLKNTRGQNTEPATGMGIIRGVS